MKDHTRRTSTGAISGARGRRRGRGAMLPRRPRRGRRRSRGSTRNPQSPDAEDRHDVGGTPLPFRRAGFPQLRGGRESRLVRLVLRQVPEKGASCVLDEEAGELGAGFVLRAKDVANTGNRRALRGANDESGDVLEEPIAFLDGECELAARTTARELARHREPGRPDDEERDESADDEEVRESDLVEVAVEPEPGHEEEGQEEQEHGADHEGPNSAFHGITRSPARPRTVRSRTGACGRRYLGSRSASSRIERAVGTRCP